ncbi:hypothetical protein Rsub_00621 [Raphidocelis subcapitata]|uniref:Uncharacterized protein n=1 Tax=Raphidocelis subcapitata TaxID=307507 RepID=A0A2V0NLF1_9CHLO|nr:hypothetical protein Rsub_00621 [Raphidocelis subcapitata]|eukprot:GBF87909.1 hypothetical protein Rsub_00621 [Raphidocelis subcapitata]
MPPTPRLPAARRTATPLLVLLVLSLYHQLPPSAHCYSPAAAAVPREDATTDPPLALPPPEADAGAGRGAGESTSIRLGEKVALDHLGPTIVHEDGTVSRISNWDQLSEAERAVAWRRITARNRERLATIKKDFEEAEQQQQQQQQQQQTQTQTQQQTQQQTRQVDLHSSGQVEQQQAEQAQAPAEEQQHTEL